jgi:hypothetical protein
VIALIKQPDLIPNLQTLYYVLRSSKVRGGICHPRAPKPLGFSIAIRAQRDVQSVEFPLVDRGRESSSLDWNLWRSVRGSYSRVVRGVHIAVDLSGVAPHDL